MFLTLIMYPRLQHGDSDVGISTSSTANLTERIRRVHGSAVANELIEFETSDQMLGFTAKGMLSNANYHVKKTTLLLFINGKSFSVREEDY